MLNRIWTVAALAAVFAVGGWASAQEKQGPKFKRPKDASLEELLSPNLQKQIQEKSRAIDIGGGATGITSISALDKALADIGAVVQSSQSPNRRDISFKDLPYVVLMTQDNSAIYLFVALPMKASANLPATSALSLLELSLPGIGVWRYNSKFAEIQCWGHLEAKHATKAALINQLNSVRETALAGFPHVKDYVAD